MEAQTMDATEIRDRRKELGWTQIDLAVRSRLAPATIYRAEHGMRITEANRAAIEAALNDGGHPTAGKQRVASTTQKG